MNQNFERVVYVGRRSGVRKEWRRRGWTFLRDKPVQIPQPFAEILLKSGDFIREDEVGRPMDIRLPTGIIEMRRWGAIGDLIMFRAACSAFKRHSKDHKFVLRCRPEFAGIFREDPLWLAVVDTASAIGSTHGVHVFDQVAEADHRGDIRHRVDLFLSAMTNEPIAVKAEDWTLPVPESTQQWVDRHLETRGLLNEQRQRSLVCVQIRGSTPAKRLPKPVMQDLIARLADDYEVMLIEHDQQVAHAHITGDHVWEMSGRDVSHTIHLMRRADAAIVFDSGVLWMAHAAPIKTLAILGPTRPGQRITYHPYYPSGVRSVSLNDIIECPACFEQATACSKQYTCMQNQPDWRVVLDKISGELEALIAADLHLEPEPKPKEPFFGGPA